MTEYEEGLKLLEEKFGGGKDNILTLATIARNPGAGGAPRPVVRGVDAYYENGVFYVMTNFLSNKMLQIAQNHEVSVASCEEMFTANGIGENLGYVMKSSNADLRTKLRRAFAG